MYLWSLRESVKKKHFKTIFFSQFNQKQLKKNSLKNYYLKPKNGAYVYFVRYFEYL